MNLLEIIDVVRPWWTTACATGAFGATTTIMLKWKRLKLTEKSEDRQGFGVLIEALQSDVRTMRADHANEMAALRRDHSAEMARQRQEHDECKARLSKIEGELMGFHRQALIASNSGIASLPASDMVKDAGVRAVAAVERTLNERGQP